MRAVATLRGCGLHVYCSYTCQLGLAWSKFCQATVHINSSCSFQSNNYTKLNAFSTHIHVCTSTCTCNNTVMLHGSLIQVTVAFTQREIVLYNTRLPHAL